MSLWTFDSWESFLYNAFHNGSSIFWATTEKLSSTLVGVCKSLASSVATYAFSQSTVFANIIPHAKITVVDFSTVLIENIVIDRDELLSRFTSLPFTVKHAYVKNVKLKWLASNGHGPGRLYVEINQIELVIDVSEISTIDNSDNLKLLNDERSCLASQSPNCCTGTPIVKDMDDAKNILEDNIHEIIRSIKVNLNDVQLHTVSGLTLENAVKHTMSMRISNVSNVTLLHWVVRDTVATYVTKSRPLIFHVFRFYLKMERSLQISMRLEMSKSLSAVMLASSSPLFFNNF